MVLATKYFQLGQKFGFFGKIQANSSRIFSNLMNMSWDLYHIHRCESFLSYNHSEGARYYFPALLTLDKKLIEVIDLCPLRMCIIMPNGSVQPVYGGDLMKKIAGDSEELASTISERFYSETARKHRDQRRKNEGLLDRKYLDELICRTEQDFSKAADVKRPESK